MPKIYLRFLHLVAGAILLNVTGAAQALLPFESTGNLYVSMWDADEVAVFTPEGVSHERFSAEGLDGPRGIAFNPSNGEIWVAGEFSNAIFIFNHNHQFLRTLSHPDFDEPVGVTFTMATEASPENQSVYISNSNGNEIMVFDQEGNLLRRFSAPFLQDPNCSAFMQDGSFFVSNRLGGSMGSRGSVSGFDANDQFQFDFTADGIQSLMAVARDPNQMPGGFDDTLWATSGGGSTGIYEFDQNGNLLTNLLDHDIDDGRLIIPQGIAFDDNGDFYVVSYLNEVIKFDSSGNFLMRFPTGSGTARSTAFQACEVGTDPSMGCTPLGTLAATAVATPDTETPGQNSASTTTILNSGVSDTDLSSGGGSKDLVLMLLLGILTMCKRQLCER